MKKGFITPQYRDHYTALVDSADLAHAIQQIISIVAQANPGFNVSRLGKIAGFKSRGFLVDVLKGRKRMGPESVLAVSQGLRLPKQLQDFLLSISQVERSGTTKENIKLQEQKQRLINTAKKNAADNEQKIFENPDFIQLYVALGRSDTGSSIASIAERTGFSEAKCREILNQLSAINLVELKHGTYHALKREIDLDGLGQNASFKSIFMQALKSATAQAAQKFEDPTSLFFHSSWSVRKEDMEELRARLRETLVEFVQTTSDQDGSRITKLTVSLF